MNRIKIGVLGPSEIANRRFIPGLLAGDSFTFAGVAYAGPQEWGGDLQGWDDPVIAGEKKKAAAMTERFGGKLYHGFAALLEDESVEAVYVPLPPGLHAKWAREALKCGKHVLLEKPFTTCLDDTEELIAAAGAKGLALHEDFAFLFHRQIRTIDELIAQGAIGEVRLIRAAFGFPYRGEGDFRYHRSMGGGALLDCGGYPLSLANHLLGGTARVVASRLCPARGHDVDVFGSAMLVGENGIPAQISFGMDNAYKCDVEIWGSQGVISTGRVYSPPADLAADVCVKTDAERHLSVEPDDQFKNSAEHFAACIRDGAVREANYQKILSQSRLFEAIKKGSADEHE